MERTGRLGKQEVHALRAMVTLARDPAGWRSVTALAAQQDLPAPMLEQLLLRLRRAGLLEARRGRLGGYRLSRNVGEISLAMILRALALPPLATTAAVTAAAKTQDDGIAVRTGGLAAGRSDTGPLASEQIVTERIATERVAAALERRLQRALERELTVITLEDLLFDLRSSQASLENEGGLMLP